MPRAGVTIEALLDGERALALGCGGLLVPQQLDALGPAHDLEAVARLADGHRAVSIGCGRREKLALLPRDLGWAGDAGAFATGAKARRDVPPLQTFAETRLGRCRGLPSSPAPWSRAQERPPGTPPRREPASHRSRSGSRCARAAARAPTRRRRATGRGRIQAARGRGRRSTSRAGGVEPPCHHVNLAHAGLFAVSSSPRVLPSLRDQEPKRATGSAAPAGRA